MNFISALVFTILIEFVVYSVFIRKDYLLLLLYSVLINSITNPLLNVLLGFGFNLIMLEIFVFIAEIFLIKYLLKTKYLLAVVISFVANLISLLIGIFLWGIL